MFFSIFFGNKEDSFYICPYKRWINMAFSQLFSSFAISVAANIVTSLFARNSTEKDIRAALSITTFQL